METSLRLNMADTEYKCSWLLHVVDSFGNTLFSGNLQVIVKTLHTCHAAIGRNLILNPFHIDRLKAKVTTFLWATQEMYFSNYVVKFTRWIRRALELLLMITLITWWFIYKCYTITHDDQLLIMHFVRLKNLFCSFQNCSTLSDRAFAHDAPVLWDLLPLTIRFPFKKTFNLLE